MELGTTGESAIEEQSPVLRLPLRMTLWATAVCVLAGWLALATLHVDDDYRVTHNQGVWFAVSQAAR